MKKLQPFTLLGFAAILLFFSECTKTVYDRRSTSLVTPESRELFGCRINGVPYSPKAPSQSSLGRCFYQPVYNGKSGWVFQINGDLHESECRFFSVIIRLDSIQLEEGKTYFLGTEGLKKNYGTYFLNTACSQPAVELYTNDDLPGRITITKFDPVKSIVTGTFSFIVKDDNGVVYRVSDGVFDRHFTN